MSRLPQKLSATHTEARRAALEVKLVCDQDVIILNHHPGTCGHKHNGYGKQSCSYSRSCGALYLKDNINQILKSIIGSIDGWHEGLYY